MIDFDAMIDEEYSRDIDYEDWLQTGSKEFSMTWWSKAIGLRQCWKCQRRRAEYKRGEVCSTCLDRMRNAYGLDKQCGIRKPQKKRKRVRDAVR